MEASERVWLDGDPDRPGSNPIWRNPDDFYQDVRRGDSPEIHLGARWFMEREQPPFALTFLTATGELVILREAGDDPYVELLGWFPSEAAMRKALAKVDPGYGQPKGVYALRQACRRGGLSGDLVTEENRRESFALHRGAQDHGNGQQGLF